MDAENKDTALRKRQLIHDSSRKMFIWVAGASVVVGFAVVIAWFLMQQIWYTEKVLAAKSATVSTLRQNNKTAPKLTENVRVLETNLDLASAKATTSENAVQVVLDALPSDNNVLALGASMQQVLIGGTPNVDLISFSINPTGISSKAVSPNKAAKTIPFTAVVASTDPGAIKTLLKRFELSVRTIAIDNIKLEQTGTKLTVSIQGHGYYVPEKVVQLNDTVVPTK